MKKLIVLVTVLLLCGLGFADNDAIANVAKNLEFSGSWKIDERADQTNVLEQQNQILEYNGQTEYPVGSKRHVASPKTFVSIIVQAECGYLLPYGYDYAKHPVSEVRPGYILQKSGPEPHTMIAIEVNNEEVKVLHSNWGAHHRIIHSTFPRTWLEEQGFKVFKPGEDHVENVALVEHKDVQGRALGTWRVEVTGSIPYHRISQGTIISHSGPGGQVRVNETRSVSNTFSTEAGVSASVISAKVGFSVTASFSRSLQYWRDVSPGKYGYVDLYYKYMVKNFNVYYDPLIGSEYFVASGKAYKWQAVEFQYRETSH